MSVRPGGRDCYCGNRGCWETEVGAHAIAEAISCPPDKVAQLDEVLDAFGKPSPALRATGTALGQGLASIVNMFNPQVVVLGGSLAQVWRAAESRVVESVQRNTLLSPRGDAALRSAALGDDSPLIGAAELAFGPVLDHPQTVPQAV
jgi:predicted NBD/HSP70 family sugar kinase